MECGRRGIAMGNDSEAMIKLADALQEDELRSMCEVQVRAFALHFKKGIKRLCDGVCWT
jgi:hypothetical protein